MAYAGTRVTPFASQSEVIGGTETFKAIDPATLASAFANLPSAANDAGAASAGVAVGHLYRTNSDPSTICVRKT